MDQNQLFHMLFNTDEITWKSIIYDAVKSEHMDPWDIDVGLIAKKYLETIASLKEHDFRVSGKMVLAAAIMLKIKSKKLLNEEIANLDALITEKEEELYEDQEVYKNYEIKEDHRLIPRTPQPRKRKISMYDLIEALDKALEVKKRRVIRSMPDYEIQIPTKQGNIKHSIRGVYKKIINFFLQGEKKLYFSKLVPSDDKHDKIYTFVPLLHLTNDQKINLNQQEHFGDIEIYLNKKENKPTLPKE